MQSGHVIVRGLTFIDNSDWLTVCIEQPWVRTTLTLWVTTAILSERLVKYESIGINYWLKVYHAMGMAQISGTIVYKLNMVFFRLKSVCSSRLMENCWYCNNCDASRFWQMDSKAKFQNHVKFIHVFTIEPHIQCCYSFLARSKTIIFAKVIVQRILWQINLLLLRFCEILQIRLCSWQKAWVQISELSILTWIPTIEQKKNYRRVCFY